MTLRRNKLQTERKYKPCLKSDIYRIYKELFKANNNKKKTKELNSWIYISPKKRYEWQTSI